MSHGPFGLGGATFGPAPACSAIVNVAPISASASKQSKIRMGLVYDLPLMLLQPSFHHRPCLTVCSAFLALRLEPTEPCRAANGPRTALSWLRPFPHGEKPPRSMRDA